MKSRICLIVPYFGSFPNYFPFWLESCAYNTNISWMLITDNKCEKLPSNVHLINMTFDELRIFIQSKFDFPISLETPYKLCDFKPCYGHIFKQYLTEYDFWGHCDMDLIWGCFNFFLNDNIMCEYDRFFTRGHLVIYRNTQEVNNWYRTLPQIKDYTYQHILSSPQSFAFDESGGKKSWGGMTGMVKANKKKQYYNICFDDVNFTHKNFYSKRAIKGFENLPQSKLLKCPTFYKYNKGHLMKYILIDTQLIQQECLYAHFQKRDFKISTNDTQKYYIIPNEFLSLNSNLNELINKSKPQLFYWKVYKVRFYNLISKIKKLCS